MWVLFKNIIIIMFDDFITFIFNWFIIIFIVIINFNINFKFINYFMSLFTIKLDVIIAAAIIVIILVNINFVYYEEVIINLLNMLVLKENCFLIFVCI